MGLAYVRLCFLDMKSLLLGALKEQVSYPDGRSIGPNMNFDICTMNAIADNHSDLELAHFVVSHILI